MGWLPLAKDGAHSDDEMFRTLNRRFLLMAGYSEQQILGLGDLAQMSHDKMEDLIQKKGLAAFGEAFNRQGKETQLLHEKKDKQ